MASRQARQVGPFELRGRVFLPAHQPGLAQNGQVTGRYVAYHRQPARSGASMQVTDATPVTPSMEWADIWLWNIGDSIVPGYQRLAAVVREEGGRMLAQLAHPGPTEEAGAEVIGPSRDFSEISRQVAGRLDHGAGGCAGGCPGPSRALMTQVNGTSEPMTQVHEA